MRRVSDSLVAHASLAALCLSLAGCRKDTADEGGPAWVVQRFVDRMGAVHGDPARAKEAYDLLWSRAQANLKERAERASALLGRLVEPQEMIAPSRFSLEFVPKEYHTQLHDGWAMVTVQSGSVSRDVRCINEEGQWRVVLDLPPLRPIETRREPLSVP
jgi:hypothetical protein